MWPMDGHATDAALRDGHNRTDQGQPEAPKDMKTSVLSYC